MKTTTITARDIQIAAAIGTMSAALGTIAGVRRGHGDRCRNTCSAPFQFAIGCTNRPIASWRTPGDLGRTERAQACPACLALRVAEKVDPRGRLSRLAEILENAGIENYRTWRAPAGWRAARRVSKPRARKAA
jgi:hypothetical protein